MNEILDEDEIKEVIDKRVKNPFRIAFIDLFLLFIINFIFVLIYDWSTLFTGESIDIIECLLNSLIFSFFFLLISLFLESFRFIYRTLQRSEIEKIIVLLNPFWLQVIEGGFGMAIILYASTLFFYAIALMFNL